SALLSDAQRHRPRRASLHPAPRRSQRRLTPFFSSLLAMQRMKKEPASEPSPFDSTPGSCASCGGASRRPFLKIDDKFHLVRCEDCGLVATSPPVPAAEIGRYYPATYYGDNNRRFNALLEGLIPFFRNRRAVAIERFVPKGRVLDVGCGRGTLPAPMREPGWDAHGLEFSETSARHG